MGGLADGGEAEIVVTRDRRRLLGAVVALVAAGAIVAIVLVTTQPGSPTPKLPAHGLLARATVTPTTAHFGDQIVAHVSVLYDPQRVVDPKLVVTRDLSSYVVAGAPSVTHRSVGRARSLVYTFRMTCLDHPCLPTDPTTGNSTDLFSLPSVEVDYARPGGAQAVQQVPLPQVEVTSRLSPLEATRLNAPPHPPLRASATPLPIRYEVSPVLLQALFVAAAVVLLAVAGVLGFRFGPRFRRRRPLPSPLERALILVEHTRTQGLVTDRRKALELLAYELGRSGEPDLALSARVLAWSEPAPEGGATGELAGEVRQSVLVRSNGPPS
jgi:hypothetical protein